MEARMPIAALALLMGFAGSYALGLLAVTGLRHRRSAMAAQGDQSSLTGFVAWRIRNGYASVLPAAEIALKSEAVRGFAEELTILCEQRGFATSCAAVLSAVAVLTGALGFVVLILTGSAIGAVASIACAVCVLAVYVGNSKDKRQEEVREAVPEALESMASCFGTGFTLLQTFRQVAQDTQGPLSKTFARSAHVLEMGGSARQALAELREGAHASELAFVAVALDVQHQTGGAMKQVLEAATDTVKGELALRRALRVQTAQAKLSARVVVVMPFILVAAFSLATPDFLAPFFSGPLGYALLALAIIMQVAGVLLVRRALSVDGVS